MPAYTAQNPYTMGLKDLLLRRAGSVVTFDTAQMAKLTAKIVSGTLRGSGKIGAVNSYIEGAEIEFGMGGWPLAALPIYLGMAVPATTGSAPSRVTQYAPPAASALPFFEMAARVQDGSGGDVHVYVPQAKITSDFSFDMKDGANFVQPSTKAMAIPDSGGLPFYLKYYEATTPLSTSLPAALTKSVSAATVASGVTTATSTAHGFGVGQFVTISGATGAAADYVNGLKQIIAVPSANSFTFAAIGAPDGPVTGTIIASY